jgi:hypothetical protein
MKINNELKNAILMMSAEEKDKLLLKLIAKDETLIARLQCQLLEDEADIENRRAEISSEIKSYLSAKRGFSTPGLLMMGMRDCNGYITHHVKITKDKLGEIELTLELINTAFSKHQSMLLLYQNDERADNFAKYVVKRADFVLQKLAKIHEDYYVEYESAVNQMLQYLADYAPCKMWIQEMKLPKKWNS